MARIRIIIGKASPVDYYVISPDHKGFFNIADSFIHAVRRGCDHAKCDEDDPDPGSYQYTIDDLRERGCRRFWHKTVTPRYYDHHKTLRGYWRRLPECWPFGNMRDHAAVFGPDDEPGPACTSGRSP